VTAPVPVDGSDKDPGGLMAVLRGLNLPEAVQKSLLGAVHRLVTGMTDYPAVWLERAVQGVRDGTAARTAVSEALAKMAVAKIEAGSELDERAVKAWLPEAVRKQENREGVAKAAVQAAADMRCDGQSQPDAVDQDWMNLFIRFAEDASSERMRDLWGQVLAREVTRPGSFSLRTVRFMSELDAKTASAFERLSELIFDADALDLPSRLTDEQFADVFILEQAGIASYATGKLAKYIDLDSSGMASLNIRAGKLHIFGAPNHMVSLNCTLLTSVGVELSRILPTKSGDRVAENIANRIPKVNLTRIEWDAGQSDQRKILWSKPND
jgi:hypothetical protein